MSWNQATPNANGRPALDAGRHRSPYQQLPANALAENLTHGLNGVEANLRRAGHFDIVQLRMEGIRQTLTHMQDESLSANDRTQLYSGLNRNLVDLHNQVDRQSLMHSPNERAKLRNGLSAMNNSVLRANPSIAPATPLPSLDRDVYEPVNPVPDSDYCQLPKSLA